MKQTVRAAMRVVLAVAVCGWMVMPAAAQTPDVQKLLTEIKAKDKGMLAVSEEDGRFLRLMIASAGRSTRSRLAARAATVRSGSAWGCGNGRAARHDSVRSRAREGARREHQARRAVRHRAGSRGRRVPADPQGPGHVRFRVPGRVEEGLQALPRHGVAAARQRRALPRPQCREQAQRDGDFLDAIQTQTAFWTTIVSPGSEGMSVSYKR